MKIGRHALSALAGAVRGERPSKFMRFARGQKDALKEAEKAASLLDRELPTVWIHAASLGEFGIARPIIKMLKAQCGCNIVLTFFSPTGYEALNRKGYNGADCVLYLPFDSSDNVRKFLDIIKPTCAVFMVSEYWHNYLHELHRRNIPAYLVSAVIRSDSPFFRWYGKLYRESIRHFRRIFVLNEESKELLNGLGVDNVAINGDPLFDNVKVISTTPWSDPVIEHFVAGAKVFLGGSLHDDEDVKLVSTLVNRHPDTRFILVPHEIQPSVMRHIEESIEGKVKFYSKCDAKTDFANCRVLVIDFVGALAYIYRYADMAYVGGGFTKLLHSIIEPAVYGLPVAFGPNVNRKVVTRQMMDLGIGRSVSTADELDEWFVGLKDDPDALKKLSETASRYVDRNVGATQRVVDKIIEDICAKK
ncbi:MAG: hypothetical protein NC212_10055 [Staphylococcus sp.]|nr:hypothetical protein [Staphylococcus sp.]